MNFKTKLKLKIKLLKYYTLPFVILVFCIFAISYLLIDYGLNHNNDKVNLFYLLVIPISITVDFLINYYEIIWKTKIKPKITKIKKLLPNQDKYSISQKPNNNNGEKTKNGIN